MTLSILNINFFQKFNRVDLINYLILTYALVLSFPSGIKRVIAILLILLWITDRNKIKVSLPQTKLFIFFGLFILFSLISYFWSDSSFQEILKYIKKYWHYIPVFIIFKYLKESFIQKSLSFFLIGILISEILSYGNFFELWQIGIGHVNDPTVFYNHTQYSIFLAISSMILLIKIVYEKSNKYKFLYLFFYTTVTLNLLLNAGRTGQIALIATFIITVIYIFRKKIINIILSFIVLVSIIIISYNINPIFNKRVNDIHHNITNMIENSNYHTSIGGRIGFWIITYDILKEKPILGLGIIDNVKKIPAIVNEKFKYLEYNKSLKHYHSDYLQILSALGVIGLILFILIIQEIFKVKIKNKEFKLIKLTTLSIFLFASLADIVFYLQSTSSLFAFIIGIILAQYKIEQNKI